MLTSTLLVLPLLLSIAEADDPFFQNIPIAPDDVMLRNADAIPTVPAAFQRSRDLTMTHYGGPFEIDPLNNRNDPINSAIGGLRGAGCGMGPMPRASFPWWHAAAFNYKEDPMTRGLPSEACGSCWRVTCIDNQLCNKEWKSVVVVIADGCPPCKNSIDVNYNSATLISNTTRRWNAAVNVERVMCPAAGSISLRVTDYKGNNNWLRLNPNNVAGLGIVAGMTVKCGGVETKLTAKWGTVFEAYPVPGGSTCSFTFTQEDGNTIESGTINLSTACTPDVPCIYDTGVQFAGGVAPPAPNGCPQCVDVEYPDTTLGCLTLSIKKDGDLCDLPAIANAQPGLKWGYCARMCGRCPANC